jgi:hypothetical protein
VVVTERVLLILELLRLFKFLTAALIREWCVPTDKDGRITREILAKMLSAGYVKRYKAEVVDPLANSTAPVYVPTVTGCCVLATMRKRMDLLLDCEPPAAWQHLSHYAGVSGFLQRLRASLAKCPDARLAALTLEHDLLPGGESENEPDRKYKLYTVVREEKRKGTEETKRIVCVPDAMIGVEVGTTRALYYLELERGTDTPSRVAAKKAPGYFGLNETKLFRRHMAAKRMRVIAACPNAAWRNALAAEMRQKPGSELWLFLALDEFKEAKDPVQEPLLYTCDGKEAIPLVKKAPEPAPADSPMGEVRQEEAQVEIG